MILESDFQASLIADIKNRFIGCFVLKNDPTYIQGFPDLLVLYGNKWAALEVKRSEDERRQPNQDYYVRILNEMSFARFVYPANKEDILNELQQSFES